jgi:polyphosphate kinase
VAGVDLPLFDRELSWLEFNRRVLGEAEGTDVPLLERLRFAGICGGNQDEFFMVRVAEVRGLAAVDAAAAAKLDLLRRRSRDLMHAIYRCVDLELLPAFANEGILLLRRKKRRATASIFADEIAPSLTVMHLDPAAPFPLVTPLVLHLIVLLEDHAGAQQMAVLAIPESVPRFFELEGSFVPAERIVAAHARTLFDGLRVRKTSAFRVIRNAELTIADEDSADLPHRMENELQRRESREVVWLEIEAGADERLVAALTGGMHLDPADVFFSLGLLKLTDLQQLYEQIDRPDLKYPPFRPRLRPPFDAPGGILAAIRERDLLLHRPYESFDAVVRFLGEAASDPDVVTIRQTLYRTDRGSPIVSLLTDAAARGKNVAAVVELQARFDERKNLAWARHLEQGGVAVQYGVTGLKTHCKLSLVERREEGGIRRYAHLSTGNYNALTAAMYTDVDLFTAEPELTADVAQVFDLIARSTPSTIAGRTWRRLVVAPMDYLRWLLDAIAREGAHARAGRPAGIAAKMNGLVEPAVIDALYRAAGDGVRIDLAVRGVCCLVPRANIRVTSVIDRFLEHSRLFAFANGGRREVCVSSGDWMPRNFLRRIETTFPIRDAALADRVAGEILGVSLADNVKAWLLECDGTYRRLAPGAPAVRSQQAFLELARRE